MQCKVLAAILWSLWGILIVARTSNDDKKRLESGNTRLFYGIITGDSDNVVQSFDEGASVNTILDPFLGEMVLQVRSSQIWWGKAVKNFLTLTVRCAACGLSSGSPAALGIQLRN